MRVKRTRRLWAMVAAAAMAAPAGVFGQASDAPGGGGGARYFAGRLMDDARRLLRDTSLPPELAARQTVILLTIAQKLDEAGAAATAPAGNAAGPDVRLLRMLAEAARTAGNTAARKEALRKIIDLDKGDLVAQVAYLDLLAGANQVLEERARIYQSALDRADLAGQIRSEMAVRLAQVAAERGDREGEAQFYQRAVGLNNVNVTALRGLARLAGENAQAVPEHIGALVALLVADPYQPDAWVELARIAENANLHDRAADYLLTALEQMQLQGAAPDGEMYLEYGTELAIAGRRPDAFGIVNALARLPDAPVMARAVAELLAQTDVPGVGLPSGAATQGSGSGGVATTRSEKDEVAARLKSSLVELAKTADPVEGNTPEGAAGALADAAGLALTVLPGADVQVDGWIDRYEKLVAPEDVTLARLRGWEAYRAGKLEEARSTLAKAAGDPMSQVGLARVLIDQGKKEEAGRQLQDVWSSHPTGLLALQVFETARRGGVTLADTQWTKQLREAMARLPAAVLVAHRQPRETVLVTAAYRKVAVGLGEPVMLTIRMSNSTDRAIPVGPAGVAVSSVGFSAATRGLKGTSLGVFAFEDVQRVFRLEPRGVMETTLRLDQGTVADVFERNPLQTFIVGVEMATAPRIGAEGEVAPGLGGQMIHLGDFERGGAPIASGADFDKLRQDLANATGEKLLVRMRAADALLGSLVSAAPGAEETARKNLTEALLPLAKSGDALVRGAWIRSLPLGKTGAEWGEAINGAAAELANDPDSLVRMMWGQREWQRAMRHGEGSAASLAGLEQRMGVETDGAVKAWLSMLIEEAKLMPAATVPAATSAGPAATRFSPGTAPGR